MARILDVRRPIPRRGKQQEVLVEWEGVEYFSQRPHPPEWRWVTELTTAHLAEEIFILQPRVNLHLNFN